MISPAEKYKNNILDIIFDLLDKNKIEVILFGSMATGTFTTHSDIDLGILDNDNSIEKFDIKLNQIRERLENSNIPYKIDLINLNLSKEEFKVIALKDKILWHPQKLK